jgi:hypothetical protein
MQEVQWELPLLDAPFAKSKIDPIGTEKTVAALIWLRSRGDPIGIAEIIEQTGGVMAARTVKAIVESLRSHHHCAIGASRENPPGYFWIRTAEDREAAVRPYRNQILTMWRTLRVLDSPASLRELHGQLRLDEVAD